MIAQRRKAGFTLIELMVVVAIFGVLSGVMFSPLRTAILQHRLSQAARNLVILARRARNDAMGTGRAHLMHIEPGSFRVRVLRGRTNSCVAQDWSGLQSDCEGNASGRAIGSECYGVTYDEGDFTMGDLVFSLAETPAVAQRTICYAPSGLVYHGTDLPSNALVSANNVEGGFLYDFSVRSADPGSRVRIPPRRVLIPLHGEARLLQ